MNFKLKGDFLFDFHKTSVQVLKCCKKKIENLIFAQSLSFYFYSCKKLNILSNNSCSKISSELLFTWKQI